MVRKSYPTAGLREKPNHSQANPLDLAGVASRLRNICPCQTAIYPTALIIASARRAVNGWKYRSLENQAN
jgi:hypothetical protein